MKNFISLLFLLFTVSQSGFAQGPIVKTDKGKVQGFENEGIKIFEGIPFAAPPVNSLRWKAPREAKKWKGILTCQRFAASPIQKHPEPFSCWTEEFIAPPSPLSEDCLYLNVWTKEMNTKKPVVLWIYGGGFNSGSAACAVYDGASYAKEDVVFVSTNYRVNIFGFFAHPEITKETSGKGAANFGLLDQVAALKWIKNNITSFGGDPDNVTIMGQSAGSFSVHALIASPLAKGLFHKAIGHSGGLLGNSRSLDLVAAEQNGLKLMSQLNKKSLADLRAMSPQDLFDQASTFNPSYSPVRDNYFLPQDLLSYYQKDLHNDVPIMGGWVTGDGSLGGSAIVSSAAYKANVKARYGDKANEYLRLFPGNTDEEAKSSSELSRRLGFGAKAIILTAELNKKPVYIYEFNHVPVDKPDFPNYGAFHTADVPFALQTLHTWNRPWREVDKQVEHMMSTYWLNFIKTGNPNGSGLPDWKPYDSGIKNIQILNSNPGSIPGYYSQEIEILK